MTDPATGKPRSITDSPWYWTYLFCTGGLIALVLIGPKYAQRQSQIEQNRQKRQLAAQAVAGQSADEIHEEAAELSVTLWPIFLTLGIVLAAAWIKLFLNHFQKRRQAAMREPVEQSSSDGVAAKEGIS